MIDFRYHLVSLVSVFLALAVGIVLGAGPLKDPISEGLSQSVQSLRQDRDALGDQLKTAQASIRNRDTFIGEMEGQFVANQLGGRSVVLVTLPGADADAVRPLTQALLAAGARVTGRIDVQEAWADPATRASRDAAITALRPTTSTPSTSTATPAPSASASANRTVTPSGAPTPSVTGTPSAGTPGTASDVAAAQLLARALVTSEVSGERSDEASKQVLDGLVRAGLVDVNGELTGRATQAVVLVPGVATAVQGAAPTPSATPVVDRSPTWVSLAAVLDADSIGAVAVGPQSSATAGGVIAALRGQPLAAGVSTVDTGGTPMGDITAVLALREQQLGGAGNYGYGDGATAKLPAPGSG
ncbi:MAG TPA: copper transporter [Kineosporiaceae bacterium]|jgi:hypothetical protein|nr:copper transporter [Kineosporiaceae bacterium]